MKWLASMITLACAAEGESDESLKLLQTKVGEHKTTDNSWFCLVRGTVTGSSWATAVDTYRHGVTGSYSNLEFAKKMLNSEEGSSKNHQMICEMSALANGTVVAKDPHGVGSRSARSFQGDGPGGFNKYWDNYPDIYRMQAACNADERCSTNAFARWYCVVHGNDPDQSDTAQAATNKVYGSYSSLGKAKRAQRDVISGRSQMICEMTEEGAKKDPHTINGLKQGDASGKNDNNDETFKKWWHDWHDITRMNALCEADTRCRYNSPVPQVVAVYAPVGESYTQEEAAKRCSVEGRKHCSKEDITGTEHCSVGWASDAKGYWMSKKDKGCGNRLGWIDYGTGGTARYAWCCTD